MRQSIFIEMKLDFLLERLVFESLLKEDKTYAEVNRLSCVDYMKILDILAKKTGMKSEEIGEGVKVYSRAAKGRPHLLITSGIHGEERAGPIALLKWLESDQLPNYNLTICPIVFPLAWDTGKRDPKGHNRNTVWNKDAPKVVEHLMALVKDNPPDVYLDLHEDSEIDKKDGEPYVFRHVDSEWGLELQKNLGVSTKKGIWRKHDQETAESFVHAAGTENASTVESNPHKPLKDRVAFQLKAIEAACASLKTTKRS
jgi:hypothetical protein